MKAIWNGTDSLFLIRFPRQLRWTKIFYVTGLRIFARLTDVFVQEHYCVGPIVLRNLERFGMRKPLTQWESPVLYTSIKRIPHIGFNVLYYYPAHDTEFNRWLYGYDIYQAIREHFRGRVTFIIADGDLDMDTVYPIIDIYIRPNRHDGNPRMVRECLLSGIPVAVSAENPDVNYFINKINHEYNRISNHPGL